MTKSTILAKSRTGHSFSYCESNRNAGKLGVRQLAAAFVSIARRKQAWLAASLRTPYSPAN
jgi:hypothetical protein